MNWLRRNGAFDGEIQKNELRKTRNDKIMWEVTVRVNVNGEDYLTIFRAVVSKFFKEHVLWRIRAVIDIGEEVTDTEFLKTDLSGIPVSVIVEQDGDYYKIKRFIFKNDLNPDPSDEDLESALTK